MLKILLPCHGRKDHDFLSQVLRNGINSPESHLTWFRHHRKIPSLKCWIQMVNSYLMQLRWESINIPRKTLQNRSTQMTWNTDKNQIEDKLLRQTLMLGHSGDLRWKDSIRPSANMTISHYAKKKGSPGLVSGLCITSFCTVLTSG